MPEQIEERPNGQYIEQPFLEDDESITYTDEELEYKWYGVPPKGRVPVYNRWKYVFMLIGIIIVEICIWAVYRYVTGVVLELEFGDYLFYGLHIVAAPTIHLLPIILFWLYVRKERGLPFVFSKKLLLTGIIVGFMAAIIWRLLEEFTYWGFSSAVGGTAGPLTFLNLLESADLFIIMTFVMYFIVGPVEELEFRGFVQDQGARALTNIQAVILSSVLFGCSHIPIALFIYQFTPTQFIDALFGWIAAGFTFGFLYMWSRNIFACIVMHGMGNWQLSVFYFAAASGDMSPGTAMMVGIATSLVSNAIMIYIFYLIHKHYWEPHRHGEPAFGGRFMKLQGFLYDHDFEKKPLPLTIAVFVIFIFLVSSIIAGAAASMGALQFAMYPTEDDEGSGTVDISDYFEIEDIDTGTSTLQEGNNESIEITPTGEGFIKSISVTITWTDEDDIRRLGRTYENQPDTFSVAITILNKTVETEGTNQIGLQGTINVELTLTDAELEEIASQQPSMMMANVEVTLVSAGNFEPRFGIIGFTDNQNEYNYEIKTIWLSPTEVGSSEEETESY